MNCANAVITALQDPLIIHAEPVIRHGESPVLTGFVNSNQLLAALKTSMDAFVGQEYKSLAIIGKTLDECERIKDLLHQLQVDLEILTGDEEIYGGGTVILPSYVAKGLEFDVVFIVCLQEGYSDQESDLKLLYVAMTRALHRLHIYYHHEVRGIFEKILRELPG